MTARKLQAWLLIALTLFWSGPVYAQTVVATPLPNAKQTFLDANGHPLTGGRVFNYVPSTTVPKTTWSDTSETVPNTNPVTLDAAGRASIWGQGNYRQVVKDVNGNTIWDAFTTAVGSAKTPGAVSLDTAPVGSAMAWLGFVAPANWMFAYGQPVSRTTYPELLAAVTFSTTALCTSASVTLTGLSSTEQLKIGAPVESTCLSPGTTVASIVSSTSITVSIAATATGSFTVTEFPWGNGDTSTTFNLPDLRGRYMAGRDNMGGVAASVLTAPYFGANGADSLAASGGAQSSTLLTANLPPYTPSGAVSQPTVSGGITGGTGGTTNNGTGGNIVPLGEGNINVSQPTFTGTPQGGTSTAFTNVPPSVTVNYIVKVTPNTSGAGGVVSWGGLFGDIVTDSTLRAYTSSGVNYAGCVTATISQIGCSQPDGTTITASGGILTAIGAAASQITTGVTGVTGAPAGGILYNNAGKLGATTSLPTSVFNAGASASSSTFWRGDGTWAVPSTAGPSVTHKYYANQLSTYGLGLTDFKCDNVTDDTPAWNAFMTATWNGTIAPFATLSFEGYSRTSYCKFNSRPKQWGNSLKIIGNPWFLRGYQPGSLTNITNTSNSGGTIVVTVPSTLNVGLPADVVQQPVRAVFTASASGTTMSVSAVTSGVLQKGMYVMDAAGTTVLAVVSACPTTACDTAGSYTLTSSASFASQSVKGRMYYIGVTGVLGTTEANGLWVPLRLSSTTIQLLYNPLGASSVFSNAFAGAFAINTVSATSGGILLGTSAGVSNLSFTNPVTSVNVGGVPGANGTFPATAQTNTSVVLQGATFSGSYNNSPNGVLYSGTLVTQPLEPFIEFGPQSDTDFSQSEASAEHLLIYSGCNWGGVGVDFGSHNINGTGYGDVNYSTINNLSVVGAACGGASAGSFGVYYRVDGSNSPGIPEGAFSGNRDDGITHYFSGAGLWMGIWLRSATGWRGYDIADQGVGVAANGGFYLDGANATLASYTVYIAGQAMGHSIVFGPNANITTISLSTAVQIYLSDATNVAINANVAFCNFAPVFASISAQGYIVCNGTVYHQ